jgi:3-hydroxyacyl-[acyl-carrier-protein] dehydratase
VKFCLVDRIESIEPGKRIVAVKALSLAEEYLADHFPAFPVMPGVLMVEALVQTAAWLVRLERDWSCSLVTLERARNVRYGNFVAPGMTLRTDVELLSLEDGLAKVKAVGSTGEGSQTVQGKLELRYRNVADVAPAAPGSDERIIADLKRRFALIGGPEALAAATGG